MLLEPDERIFDALLAKARTGDYVAMTNTDQDVLEAYFCPGPRQWVGEPHPPNHWRGPMKDTSRTSVWP